MGLVDLAGVSARSFCGVGFSISGPLTSWRVVNSPGISLTGISELDDVAAEDVKRIVEVLRARGAGGFTATLAAGLSSLGPLLYCVFDRRDGESQSLLESMSRQMGAAYLGAFSGNNTGFAVESI
jgi:predicted sugar kinase